MYMLEYWNGWDDDDKETRAAGVADNLPDAVAVAKFVIDHATFYGRDHEVTIYKVNVNEPGRSRVGVVRADGVLDKTGGK